MSFFTKEQEHILFKLHRHDPGYKEMISYFRDTLEPFIATEIAPRAAENDAREIFAREQFPRLGDLGFMALSYPEAFGGLDQSFVYYAAGLESLAKADAGFTLGLAIHGTMTEGVYRFASDELKQKYVPELIQGKLIGCFALTESDAGSDAKALRCTWKRDASTGEYILNGTKFWITNGMVADLFFVMAKHPETDAINAFLLDRDGKGHFEQQVIHGKMGVRGSNTAELIFEDYRIPANCLVGEEGAGFKYALNMLNGGRVTIAAWSTGVAQGAYEKFLKYAHERKLFGKTLKDLDNTRRELSEMLMEIRASREMAYDAAFTKQMAGDDLKAYAQAGALAKVFASEQAFHVCERAIALAGGYGFLTESNIERHLRDAILGRIGEGANEALKIMVIPRFIEADFARDPITETW